jgi:hypothetical protein
MITLTLEEAQQILNLLKTLHAKLNEPWVKTYSGGKPNYTQPCERCGEVNPAEIHTCTPIENLTSEKNIQISDNND